MSSGLKQHPKHLNAFIMVTLQLGFSDLDQYFRNRNRQSSFSLKALPRAVGGGFVLHVKDVR